MRFQIVSKLRLAELGSPKSLFESLTFAITASMSSFAICLFSEFAAILGLLLRGGEAWFGMAAILSREAA